MPSLLGTGPGMHYKCLLKTDNQSLKHKVNRCVLSLRLTECKLWASRTAAGRLSIQLGRPHQHSLMNTTRLMFSSLWFRTIHRHLMTSYLTPMTNFCLITLHILMIVNLSFTFCQTSRLLDSRRGLAGHSSSGGVKGGLHAAGLSSQTLTGCRVSRTCENCGTIEFVFFL